MMKKETPAISKSICYMDTPVGKIIIAEDGAGITDLYFVRQGVPVAGEERDTVLLLKARVQISSYFAGKLFDFDLPLSLKGTAFQTSVWQALLGVPFGETRSYQQIAEQIGSPKAFRAVGMANNRNPVSIIVPCHRVIGKDGSLVGYGSGLPTKKYLLRFEEKTMYERNVEKWESEHGSAHDFDKVLW